MIEHLVLDVIGEQRIIQLAELVEISLFHKIFNMILFLWLEHNAWHYDTKHDGITCTKTLFFALNSKIPKHSVFSLNPDNTKTTKTQCFWQKTLCFDIFEFKMDFTKESRYPPWGGGVSSGISGNKPMFHKI